MKGVTIQIVSCRPVMAALVQRGMLPIESRIYDGAGAKSFSALVNGAVAESPTEVVIISADKVAPTHVHVRKVVDLLRRGFGLVALYRFAFFGFHKELFRRIGPFDERFVGGGYEDDDFMVRMAEADIALYVNEEVPYTPMKSSWPDGGVRTESPNKYRFMGKWGLEPGGPPRFARHEPEPDAGLGPPGDGEYLPFSASVLLPRFEGLRSAFTPTHDAVVGRP